MREPKEFPSPELAERVAAERARVAEKLGAARRRVLLVGGAGYIGGPLTTHLLRLGYQVTCLDLLLYGHGSVVLAHAPHPDYRLVVGDMGDRAALDEALRGVTDVVILAGLVGDPITRKFPREAADVNDEATGRCIDALDGRGLERVIFVSTCSNYGLVDGDSLVNEESPLSPLSLYAKSKVAAEQRILALRGRVDYHPTILRFATAFGLSPRMRFDLTVNEFVRELSLGRELVVYDPHTWRPYCHVRDFGRLISRVLEVPPEDVSFEVFNAGGEVNNHTKKSIVDIILSRLPDRKVSYASNSSDRRNYRVDFSKARERLDFEPLYRVEDGVDEICWAIGAGLFDMVDREPDLHGNFRLPGLANRLGRPVSRQPAPV